MMTKFLVLLCNSLSFYYSSYFLVQIGGIGIQTTDLVVINRLVYQIELLNLVIIVIYTSKTLESFFFNFFFNYF